ncbi:MAG: VOC family protein [Armatimonadetes bacterium]|nr:VOC family protein [Armatimonadota bacterium]
MSDQANHFALAAGRAFPWHELYVPDVDAALAFYTGTLGFGTDSMPMGDGGTYHMLTRDGTPVAGLMSTSSEQMQGVPTHWACYTSVPNLDESLAAVQAKGATMVVGIITVPNVGRMALISDPQGAHIWLFEPQK